jgi:hypothetical protein
MKKKISSSKTDGISPENIAALIEQSRDELMVALAKGFDELHKRADALEQRMIVDKEELKQLIRGTNNRIDDLAQNRARKEEVAVINSRLELIEQELVEQEKS